MTFSWHVIKHAQLFSLVLKSYIAYQPFIYINSRCFTIHHIAISLLS